MARRLDQILVVDIEATCWQGPPPEGQVSEIIEVGIATLEVGTCERVKKESLLVRPVRSRVSAFCTELTTLTQDEVDGGVSLADACAHLRKKYRSRSRTWASYGDYDRLQFERQCERDGVEYPFSATHLNVKSLLGLALGMRFEVGMAKALALLGLPLQGTHHRGVDDAWNIAALLAELLRRLRGSPDPSPKPRAGADRL